MLTTLRRHDFALVWAAGLVSYLGDWALIAALPVWVYLETGSALASGLLWVAWALPGVLLGSVAGVYVDRWDRKRTMVAASLARAAVLLALVPAAAAGWAWAAYPAAVANIALAQFFAPAENALLPRLVGAERLVSANALNALNDNAGRIAGSALGGFLLAGAGIGAVALFDAATFLAAALLVSRVAAPGAPAPGGGRDGGVGARPGLRREWAEGVAVVRRSPLLRAVFLVAGVATLADGAATALLVPFVAGLGGSAGEETFGLFLAVRGAAGLLGSALVGWLGPRAREADLVGWGLVAVGAGFGVIFNSRSVPLVLGVLVLIGPGIAAWLTGQQTLLQKGAEDRYRGRVFGAFGTAVSLLNAAALGAASLLGDVLGARPVLTAGALLYAAAGVVALTVLRRAARSLLGGHPRERDAAEVRG